jgi:predicted nucleic acid-binding protein
VLAFFDTNVLVYCTDASAPAKLKRARSLVVQAAVAGDAVLSTQVLIELFHVLTRQQRMPAKAAQTLIAGYAAWPLVQSDAALVHAAIGITIAHQLSIWDAMVVAAALHVGAQTLYTEDLSDGQRFGALTVVNPFAVA